MTDHGEVGLGTTFSHAITATITRPFSSVARAPARAFAVSRHARRVRRPTDITLLILTSITLVWFTMRADGEPSGLHAALITLIESIPGFLEPLMALLSDWITVWAVVLMLLAGFRRHWTLVRDQFIAVGGVLVGASLLGRIATGEWPGLVESVLRREVPVDYPPLLLAASVAVVSVSSPHLSRPLRYFGRWTIVLGAIGAAAIGVGIPGHTGGAAALGWAVAAAIHLLFGSPGGLPALDRVRLGLEGMGVDAEPIDVESRGGVVWVRATAADGAPLHVKVYGRDAWDGQLLISLWRFVWYRDAGPTITVSRVQQVEHEAFLTLFAERHDVPVSRVVTAGLDVGGDALLVTESPGVTLANLAGGPSDAQIDAAWAALARLHAAGVVHGWLDLERIRVDGDRVLLSDFASAELERSIDRRLIDQAQLLMSTAITAGLDRALDGADRALGPDGLAALSSFVQPAALPPALRRAAETADLDIDNVRARLSEVTGRTPGDLVKLRRLSIGTVLLTLLFAVACYAFVSSIMDVGLDTIIDALKGASVPILILAWFIGLTPRVANAMALNAATPAHVPLGRLTALQFSITFVNLAMPSSAARAAVVIRFFQRSGVDAPQAVTIGLIDSVSGFLAQISLMAIIMLFGLGSLDLGIAENLSAEGLGTLGIILLIVLVLAVAVLVFVPKVRRAIHAGALKAWHEAKPLLTSPGLLIRVYLYNMLAELLFALCMYTVLRSFGQDVNYFDVVLVNEFVALFAGLMPVPGGVGVTEAALTAGFIAIGVDEATAFAAAITYRVVTFYTPPILGSFAFNWLKRQRYL
jgi:uncharacterized membrane protein YbhN (UPF0104 family)